MSDLDLTRDELRYLHGRVDKERRRTQRKLERDANLRATDRERSEASLAFQQHMLDKLERLLELTPATRRVSDAARS